jgi:N-methylhydantoinase B
LVRGYWLLADNAVLVMRSDRCGHLPYGLAGGRPGTPSWNVLNPGPNQRTLSACPMSAVPMVGGDEFVHIQAGAGGYGDPLDRDAEPEPPHR